MAEVWPRYSRDTEGGRLLVRESRRQNEPSSPPLPTSQTTSPRVCLVSWREARRQTSVSPRGESEAETPPLEWRERRRDADKPTLMGEPFRPDADACRKAWWPSCRLKPSRSVQPPRPPFVSSWQPQVSAVRGDTASAMSSLIETEEIWGHSRSPSGRSGSAGARRSDAEAPTTSEPDMRSLPWYACSATRRFSRSNRARSFAAESTSALRSCWPCSKSRGPSSSYAMRLRSSLSTPYARATCRKRSPASRLSCGACHRSGW
mmetsp:Transcript_38362/g.120432  ORF Transcript_38362/g.120432 Transcript_38362/m.120432 type:complete len:262 (-) Transcript_38362:139-924(-)